MKLMETSVLEEGRQASNAWRLLGILFLANLLNVYDRIIPAVLAEPLRLEFKLSDLQLGLISTAFTVVYAVSGLPLARLADRSSRKVVIGLGLGVWSVFTALTGMAGGFVSFLLIRMGVGIGESSYAPAAHSLISDLFPKNKRSRAVGIFMLGIPLGAVLSFATVGPIAAAFGTWRAPFFMAAIPGLMLAVLFFLVREPRRGASESGAPGAHVKIARPIRTILRIRTMWWLILSGLGGAFATYAATSFMMPLLQRYFNLDVKAAGMLTAALIGLTGVLSLTTAGALADKMHQRRPAARLTLCTISMGLAAVMTWFAFKTQDVSQFAWLFGLGWLAANIQAVCIYPAVQDLVVPQLRATAIAVFLAALYLVGAAFGTVAVGALSDYYANAARLADNLHEITEAHRAIGLHGAMVLIPITLLLASFASWMASRSYLEDVRKVGQTD